MKIESCNNYLYETNCDKCLISDNNNCIEINKNIEIYLCDECLQEINRKIVDYLADKNI